MTSQTASENYSVLLEHPQELESEHREIKLIPAHRGRLVRHLSLYAMLLLCSLALSQVQQNPPPKLPVIRLGDGSISGLGPFYSHGTGFWIAATDKTAILASGEDLGEVFAVAISIQNTSETLLTFDPSEVRAFDLVAKKYLNYISPSALAKKTRRPSAWARFGQGFARGAALASQESTQQESSKVSGDFSGQTYSGTEFRGTFDATVTTERSVCDAACVQARTILLAKFADEDKRRSQHADTVEALGLGKETLAPNAQIMGYVYFSKPKKGNAPKPSGGQLDNSLDVNVVVPVGSEKYRLFFPTELFDELTKGPR
jgi:hypothetical protein